MTIADAGTSVRPPWTFVAARVLLVVQGLSSWSIGALVINDLVVDLGHDRSTSVFSWIAAIVSPILGALFLVIAPMVRARDWAGRVGVLGELVNALLAVVSLVLGVFVAVVALAVSIFVMVQLLRYAGAGELDDVDEDDAGDHAD